MYVCPDLSPLVLCRYICMFAQIYLPLYCVGIYVCLSRSISPCVCLPRSISLCTVSVYMYVCSDLSPLVLCRYKCMFAQIYLPFYCVDLYVCLPRSISPFTVSIY